MATHAASERSNSGRSDGQRSPGAKFPPGLERDSAPSFTDAPAWNFSLIPVSRAPISLQTKLQVGAVDDPLEREADEIADRVIGMPRPRGEQESPASSAAADLTPGVPEVMRGTGQPLDPMTRSFFEPRFGRDLGAVRIYADQAAARSARALNALAYTVGSKVAFSGGNYAPGTNAGRRLLAHELAHVVQQTGHHQNGSGAVRTPGLIQRKTGSDPETKEDSARFEGDKQLGDVTAGIAKLKKGDTGLPVTKLQQALVDLDYLPANAPNGTFEDPTRDALLKF